MEITRREFMDLSGKAMLGATIAPSFFNFLAAPRGFIEDILASPRIKKIHQYIEDHKTEHIAKIQADLRQPSVSSWNMGITEMAERMKESFYKHYGIEPAIWPRAAGSSPQAQYTRPPLNLPACAGGLGHGGRAHAVDEYLIIVGNERVAGLVKMEQSIVDILYAYAHWPE
jgi:hypothetical protein